MSVGVDFRGGQRLLVALIATMLCSSATGSLCCSVCPTSGDRIFLQSGQLNGRPVDVSEHEWILSTGETQITGVIKIEVQNDHVGAIVPVVWTRSWSDPGSWFDYPELWRTVTHSTPTGSKTYEISIDIPAPMHPGFIIFASAGQAGGEYIASQTFWKAGTQSWGDGYDLADNNLTTLIPSASSGSICVMEWDGVEYKCMPYGATYVRVVPEPATLLLLGLGGLVLRRRRR